MDRLSLTARWTAAIRARESERSDALFHDPLAALLADDQGVAYEQVMRGVTGQPGSAIPAVEIRTRYFDDILRRVSMLNDTRQSVFVAAGMDSRAFRLDWPPETRPFELDRPELLALKDQLLTESKAIPGPASTGGPTQSRPAPPPAFRGASS